MEYKNLLYIYNNNGSFLLIDIRPIYGISYLLSTKKLTSVVWFSSNKWSDYIERDGKAKMPMFASIPKR